MKKSKPPVIEDIIVSEETMKALSIKLKRSCVDKHRIIRNYVGGSCTYCYLEIPSKKVSYDVGDGDKLVEWFCSSCFEKHKSELNNRLQDINLA